MSFINTESASAHLRQKAINVAERKILITNFHNSQQEEDLTEPPNCEGYGRVRHFKIGTGENWPINPLPILPAAKALNIPAESKIRAQVFQNSVCNWRCWYCFVDFKLLNGDVKHAEFLSCDEMVDMYLKQPDPPFMIDLTGGQPDLTPEWIPWMMETLRQRELDKKIYLWSDDNLSNDYFWKYLTEEQLEVIRNYTMYSRVCCFKGIDEASFSLNTKADPALFNNQFLLAQRLVALGIDLYFYVTITASSITDFDTSIPSFLDRLQNINSNLPLRMVPLEIAEFTPVTPRMTDITRDLIKGQYKAMEVWQKELQRRFDSSTLKAPITEISIY
ncbi:MAG TPA: radical SAM protein [Puia sp.]|nr:radical SAM protein [Puia sp.]